MLLLVVALTKLFEHLTDKVAVHALLDQHIVQVGQFLLVILAPEYLIELIRQVDMVNSHILGVVFEGLEFALSLTEQLGKLFHFNHQTGLVICALEFEPKVLVVCTDLNGV